ncbi:hypothetical protein CNMCM7691_003369 [Aspergillus felis]|uniref:Glucose-methanol-choline oxidoreductase N-terminal domain-containing protein n=1 Tax=Aspergillus felis TaxID=1287682 RepID=A0A8H6QKI2_9EURO|nr:hypothetical protein CNMCM7691_003369 [Aspergillus felis]
MTPSLLSLHRLLPLAAGFLHLCSTTVWATPLPGQSTQARVLDYVIVDSGPGGSTVANRLTEIPDVSVAMIEAGTWAEDVVGNLSAVPGYDGYFLLKSVKSTPTAIHWGFVTIPQTGINGQIARYPRGKVLGGSSNLNAMAWGVSSRGAFQKWADAVGDQSFTYDKIAQYYKKPVRFSPYRDGTRLANATPSYDPTEVGHTGPLDVTYPAYAYSWTTWLAVMQATDSFLDGSLNGSTWHMSAINQSDGTRSSADKAYLRPVLGRSNLAVFDNTLAERIVFNKDKSGHGRPRELGQCDLHPESEKGGHRCRWGFPIASAAASLWCWAKGSAPKHGIPVVANRPSVGQHMHDRIFSDIVYRVSLPTGSTLGITEADIVQYDTNATGPLSNPGGEFGGFEKIPADLRSGFSKTRAQGRYPSFLFLLLLLRLICFRLSPRQISLRLARNPVSLSLSLFLGDLGSTPSPNGGYNYASLMGTLMTPTSRGNVSISSSSMRDPPLINPNWMTTDADLEVMVAIFKRMRQVWNSPAIQALTIGEEYWPGPSVKTDEEIIAFLRQTAPPMSHATSTCKMGKTSDPMAVVDSQCRVIGVRNSHPREGQSFNYVTGGVMANQAGWLDIFPHERILETATDGTPLVVDVGGNIGHDMERFRQAHPEAASRLYLQDRPEVVKLSKCKDPVNKMGYDFFTPQPVKGLRVYYMHGVLHD